MLQCAAHGARFENTKYTIQRMLEGEQQTSERGRMLLASATVNEIYALWNVVSVAD